MKTSLLSDIRINLISESNIPQVGHRAWPPMATMGRIRRQIYINTSSHVGVLGSISPSISSNSLHIDSFFVQRISPAVLDNTSIMQLLCV